VEIPKTPDRPLDRAVWGAAAAGVLATYVVQIATLGAVKLAAKEAGFVGGKRPGRSELIDLALGTLGPLDWFGIVLGVAAALALVLLEIRGRRVSRAIAAALATPGAAWPLLAIVGALTVRSYLDPGIPHLFDAKQHYAKIVATSQILADGEWPTWTWRWYGGFPLLRFYAPLLYLTAGGLGALIGPEAGLKAVLVVIHLSSGWMLGRFVRAWAGSHRAAVIATVAYLLVFQRFHSLLAIGRLPEAPLYLFFPWLLLCVERFVERGAAREGLRAGAVLAAMVLTHPVMGALGGVFGGLYALLRLAAVGKRRPTLPQTAGFAALTGLFGFLLAAFWIGPALALRQNVLLEHMYGGGLGALVPFSFDLGDMQNLVQRGSPSRTGASIAYAGWSLLALAAVAGWRHLRREPGRTVPVLGMIVVGLIYAGGGYFLARAVVFLPAFLAAAAGWAVAHEPDRIAPTWVRPLGVGGLVVLALLGDFLPGTLRSPFRPDLRPLQDSLQLLADRTAGTKAVVASRRGERLDISQWTGWDDSSLMVLGGPFREAATRLFGWQMTALARIEDDLRDGGPLEKRTVDALRLLGVEWVVVEDGTGLADPNVEPGAGYTLDPELPGVRIEGARAVYFARRAEPLTDDLDDAVGDAPVIFDIPRSPEAREPWDAAFDALLAVTGDGADGSLLSLPLPSGAEPLDDLTLPIGSVSVTRSGHRRMTLDVHLEGRALAVLPLAWFPGVTALAHRDPPIDLPVLETLPGFLAIDLEPGAYRVTLEGPRGPPTRGWFFLSALAWLVWLWGTRDRRASLPRPEPGR